MNPWYVQQVEPQTSIMEKIIMEKPVNLPQPPDFTGKINYGNNSYLQELWKKTGSDHFRDILNPYGEKFNYGKIGRRRRLSKLNIFFLHNSVGDQNSLHLNTLYYTTLITLQLQQ